jgi:hypothetical protein
MPDLSQILARHVRLEVSCVDRIYLCGYVPILQTPGQLIHFLLKHLQKPIPSPALFRQLTQNFRHAVEQFAKEQNVPLRQFTKGERKDDVAAEYRKRFSKPEGVYLIGTAQEKASAFYGRQEGLSWHYSRRPVFVTQYYFYLVDRDFGPAFIKVCTYFPFGVKVCLNGHEWAKKRLEKRGIHYEALDNGFLSCSEPEKLQAICDSFDHRHIERFFRRWVERLPWPLSSRDRRAGYEHNLSILQLELSLTHVFDRPVHGREFFEEVIRENLDLGRPDRVQLLFPQRLTRRTPPPRFGYRTRVITDGVNPSLHVEFKHSHVKQYFKENRALRTETTINDSRDFQVGRLIRNLDYLIEIGQNVNRRLLGVQRISHDCVLTADSLREIVLPSLVDGQRVPALRFGEPRVLALLAALCSFAHTPDGFSNQELRNCVAALLDPDAPPYGRSQMTYDLRKLRLKGMIQRLPGKNRYLLTPRGIRWALFLTKVYSRIVRPFSRRQDPPPSENAPQKLKDGFRALDAALEKIIQNAGLSPGTSLPKAASRQSPAASR